MGSNDLSLWPKLADQCLKLPTCAVHHNLFQRCASPPGRINWNLTNVAEHEITFLPPFLARNMLSCPMSLLNLDTWSSETFVGIA